MSACFYESLATPIGELLIISDRAALLGAWFVGQRGCPTVAAQWLQGGAVCGRAIAQLRDFFNGERERFDLPLAPVGTPFQREVWSVLCGIDLGQTRTYAELASTLGRANAARAVGAANGRNPISIIVPCHRVIGANGTLTGYAGGLDRKRWLLDHEARIVAARQPA